MLYDTSRERHYCRNPRCRTKLPVPVVNPRDAFCARGCRSVFYRTRCLVCEAPIGQPKHGTQKLCKKAKCRNAFRRGVDLAGSPIARTVKAARKVPDFIGSEVPPEAGRACRQVAGPELTPSQPRRAIVPDGPFELWAGGEHQRLEARSAAMLREHFREQAAKCLIGPTDPPVNIRGGYRFPGAPEIKLAETRPATTAFVNPDSALIPDDLSIPQFLRRGDC